jgi:hypothetical protein
MTFVYVCFLNRFYSFFRTSSCLEFEDILLSFVVSWHVLHEDQCGIDVDLHAT